MRLFCQIQRLNFDEMIAGSLFSSLPKGSLHKTNKCKKNPKEGDGVNPKVYFFNLIFDQIAYKICPKTFKQYFQKAYVSMGEQGVKANLKKGYI